MSTRTAFVGWCWEVCVEPAAGAGGDAADLGLDWDRGRDALAESELRGWRMVYLVVMRVCKKWEGGLDLVFFIGKWHGQDVQLWGGRRGGGRSFGAMTVRWENMAYCVEFKAGRNKKKMGTMEIESRERNQVAQWFP